MANSAAAVLLAAVAFTAVNAVVDVQYGDKCIAEVQFPHGEWPKGWDMCPKNESTQIQDECCVSSCMATLLEAGNGTQPWFKVCSGGKDGGYQVEDFEWASQYCDCPFREYCNFACCPTCDTPMVSSNNKVFGPLKSAGFMSNTDNETDSQITKFGLRHDSRNLCPVFFFAIFQTGNVIAIDWASSVLYMPFYFNHDDDEAYSCEEIIAELRPTEKAAWCKPSQDIDDDIQEGVCHVQLPGLFWSSEGDRLPARYIAYSNCGFKYVKVMDTECED